jgi:hypothetical protein
MPATIHRTRYSEGIGLLFGDWHALAFEHCDRHAQFGVSDDFDILGFTLDMHVVTDQGAALIGFIYFNRHGRFLMTGVLLLETAALPRILATTDQRSTAHLPSPPLSTD